MTPATEPRARKVPPPLAKALGRRRRGGSYGTAYAPERLEGRTLFASFAAATVGELVAAIRASNATAGADTLTLAAGTTFTLTSANNATDGPTGLPSVVGSLTILGGGGVIQRSAAAGTPAFRLFDVNPGASLTLKNLTLRNGRATGFSFVEYGDRYAGPPAADHVPRERPRGGAVFNEGTLALAGVTLAGNAAVGADAAASAAVTRHAGTGQGGGVFSSGAMSMTGCVVRDNAATGGQGQGPAVYIGGGSSPASPAGAGAGGGVFVAGGKASFADTQFVANTARGGWGGWGARQGGVGVGGGLRVAAGTVTVARGAFTTNAARGGGGGVDSDFFYLGGRGGDASGGGAAVGGGTLTVAGTAFNSNSARGADGTGDDFFGEGGGGGHGSGGALTVSGGTVSLASASLSANVARGGNGGFGFPQVGDVGRDGDGGSGSGGGIYAGGGTLVLRRVRAESNTAVRGAPGLSYGHATSSGFFGKGIGGGLRVVAPAVARLDAFTKTNIRLNFASTSGKDVAGTYVLIP